MSVSAAEPASLIVIVDASGSMSGALEGGGRQNKVDLVREALRTSLEQIGTQPRIGLAAFGHRRKSCSDVEVIRTPEPVDLQAMIAQLAQVQPRGGRGPLTLALREAAKSLPEGSGPRSLLLIHDGPDNCQQDVCAAAAELSGAGITAHVVSVGVAPEDLAKVACLPQATGGRHFKAQNAAQLATFIGEAMRLASNRSVVAGFSTTIVPPAPIPASGPAALYLRALFAPNTEPLGIPLHWVVSAEDQPQGVLFEAWTVNPVVPVPPGRYLVEVSNGFVTKRESVLVRENRPLPVPILLGAGTVHVKAAAKRTGTPLPDAIVTLSAGKADSPPLAVFKSGEAAPLLQPGRYVVRAELGHVRAEPQVVEIEEGQAAPVDIALDAVRLQLVASARDGMMPLDAPIFIVTEDDPPRGRREVARSAARQAELVLPPNIYYIVARQGSVEAHQRVAIGSGDAVRVTLTAAAGRLSLSATGPGSAPLAADLLSYIVKRIDDPQQKAITTGRPAPVLFLPSGRYRIEGHYGLTNVETVREVEIKGGQALQLSLEHQLAALRLRHAGAPAEVAWEVRDEDRRVVWTSGDAEAGVALQAGRYLVTAQTPAKREERAVELRAGDTRVVEFRGD
jgi:Ca-activated chloride channel homolog